MAKHCSTQILSKAPVSYTHLDFATAKSKMEEYMKDYPDDEDAAREYQFLETRQSMADTMKIEDIEAVSYTHLMDLPQDHC